MLLHSGIHGAVQLAQAWALVWAVLWLLELPSIPVTEGNHAMAYTDRTITLRFDGTQVLDGFKDDKGPYTITLPNLGDDVWAVVRNPMLMPQTMLTPKRDVPVDANGQPLHKEDALNAGSEVVAGLIVSWNLTDPMSDDDAILSLPCTAEQLRNQVPAVVGDVIAELIGRARNPR